MEAKRSIIRDYVAMGLKLEIALAVSGLSRSTYYYRPNGKHKGRRPSTTTIYKGKKVSNEQVVDQIKKILAPEFIDYGYKRTTAVLKEMDYLIGKSKVYRLMKEHRLLHPQIRGRSADQRYRVYTSPQPDRPFEILEIDIKYVYIHGERTNGYLITILDTFHRQAYEWGLFRNMKTERIIELILKLMDRYLIPNRIDPKKIKIVIRTDNGSQFTSAKYNKVLDELNIIRNYIPLATPQMNGHIEGFHSTVKKLVCDKYYFHNFYQAKQTFERFFKTYNHERIMSAILNKRPAQFLNLWQQGRIGYLKVNGKNKFFFKEQGTNHAPSSPEVFGVN